MMAMFGWSAAKLPAHYIVPANREKPARAGMDKITAFDETGSSEHFMAAGGGPVRMSGGNGAVSFPGHLRRKI